MPTQDTVFKSWAPLDSVWSDWVKPVVFAYLEDEPFIEGLQQAEGTLDWLPPSDKQTALVFDLPGVEGVKAGLAAAKLGYRPVPLYNALPLPIVAPEQRQLYYGEPAPALVAVNMLPVMAGLWNGADILAQIKLAPDAPPAFLLDANRRNPNIHLTQGMFDNRWACFTTDFPSAQFLLQRDYRRAVFVQNTGLVPQNDLRYTLAQWQKGGLAIARKSLNVPGLPEACSIKPLSWLARLLFYLKLSNLHKNGLGSYGEWVPEYGSG